MSIRDQLMTEQRAAMKSGEKATVNVIRQIESEVALVRTAEGFSGEVDDALYRRTIESYVKKMEKARREYENLGERGRDQADKLAFEIDYLSRYIPKKLDEEATLALVRSTMAAMGATEPRQRGEVIGAVMRSTEDLDGAVVARLVAQELGG
jgi:uncharacterized protein YqeY